jgi:uncharacterized protein YodC (DUF2158 family)
MRIAVIRKFETGTVVQLKSGGHKMTVSDPFHDDKQLIDVEWLDSVGVLHRDCFHEDCLTTSDQNEPEEK